MSNLSTFERAVQPRNDEAPSDDQFRAAAHRLYGRDGEMECDDEATVSRSEDDPAGAYVAMWVWVSNGQASDEAGK